MIVADPEFFARASVFILILTVPVAIIGNVAILHYVPRSRFRRGNLIVYNTMMVVITLYDWAYGRVAGIIPPPFQTTADFRPFQFALSVAILAIVIGMPAMIVSLNRMQREFIANVSHELRTPLAIIYGYATLGAEGYILPDVWKSLEASADRMRFLIDNILGTYSLEEGKSVHRGCFDLTAVVNEAVQGLRVIADERHIEIVAAEKFPPVYANETLVLLVLNNLIDNAIKFNHTGGRVAIFWDEGKESITLIVEDNGIGMSRRTQAVMFDRFVQGDGSDTRRYSGVGLGLHFVKLVAHAHKATIDVDSKIGHGTMIKITFPKVKGHECD